MKIIDGIRNILAVLAALIVLLAVLCLILNYEPAIVMSGSMEPVIGTGSMVLVDKDECRNAKIGDAIAFKTGGAYITHRVVNITSDGYITRGDANDTDDPWIVRSEQVKGKIVLCIPTLGYICAAMASTPGVIIIGCLIICIGLSTLLTATDEKEDGEVELAVEVS